MRERNYFLPGNYSFPPEGVLNPAYWEVSPVNVNVNPIIYRVTVEENGDVVRDTTSKVQANASLFALSITWLVAVMAVTF